MYTKLYKVNWREALFAPCVLYTSTFFLVWLSFFRILLYLNLCGGICLFHLCWLHLLWLEGKLNMRLHECTVVYWLVLCVNVCLEFISLGICFPCIGLAVSRKVRFVLSSSNGLMFFLYLIILVIYYYVKNSFSDPVHMTKVLSMKRFQISMF